MPDLHQWYGVDTGDRELMRRRSWPWLQDLIVGLLSQRQPPSRLAALLLPPPASGG